MGGLGWSEVLVIFIVALVVFGPRKLPELGKSLGRGLAEFKKASNDLRRTWEDEVKAEEASVRQAVQSVDEDLKSTIQG